MATITICSSAAFYRQAATIKSELESFGLEVIIPDVAEKMRESGDYDVTHYKTWFGNPNDYHRKTALMKAHFAEIEKGDAILVLNYEKNGTANYIGGNVLMEMTIAFYLNKPIYILNEIPEDSAYLEEILGLQPITLNGNLNNIPVA